jgi:hypothetical protein
MRARAYCPLGDGVSSLVLLGLIATAPLAAAERHVPGGYPTIQAAIAAADPGDVVIVAAGTYTGSGNRDLDLYGKAIIIRSTDPNDPNVVVATVLDCQGTPDDPHRAFAFRSGEGPGSMVAGLTLTNGYGPPEILDGYGEPVAVGGAVFCNGSSPSILSCRIEANGALAGGGLFAVGSGSPLIRRCTFSGNSSGSRGGGIGTFQGSSPTIVQCLVTGK